MKYRVGVDLGGTKMLLSLAGEDGEIISSRKFPTRAAEGPDAIISHLIGSMEEILSQEGISFKNVEGMGLCIAGFFDIRSRHMVSSPNLPFWEMFPLEKELRERLHLPVVIENDANAAAYGEYVYGAGRGTKNMINVTLGTGIGGGIIIEGELYRGSGGFAGEIGHIIVLPQGPRCGCGRNGCLESLSSGSAVEREGRLLLQKGISTTLSALTVEQLTASHIFAAARDGDPEAKKIVERAAYFLGLGLSYVVNILNLEIIVMGGGMAHAGEILFDPVRRSLMEAAIQPSGEMVTIVPAAMGEEAGVRGILSLLDQLLKGD